MLNFYCWSRFRLKCFWSLYHLFVIHYLLTFWKENRFQNLAIQAYVKNTDVTQQMNKIQINYCCWDSTFYTLLFDSWRIKYFAFASQNCSGRIFSDVMPPLILLLNLFLDIQKLYQSASSSVIVTTMSPLLGHKLFHRRSYYPNFVFRSDSSLYSWNYLS